MASVDYDDCPEASWRLPAGAVPGRNKIAILVGASSEWAETMTESAHHWADFGTPRRNATFCE
jgi:hypothetical protein